MDILWISDDSDIMDITENQNDLDYEHLMSQLSKQAEKNKNKKKNYNKKKSNNKMDLMP
jgi:predicted RNA-binding protein with RPS1 domain